MMRHLTRTFIAGIVAILPIGGLVLSVLWTEWTISESWLANQPWYFPGLGLIAVAVAVYAIGLFITTFMGRWIWSCFDSVLKALPLLGPLYTTLQQILGYGEGEGAMFERVVLVPCKDTDAEEFGLVTKSTETDKGNQLIVFIPSAPNITNGRMVVIDESRTKPLDMKVSDALKAIVSVGKTAFEKEEDEPGDVSVTSLSG